MNTNLVVIGGNLGKEPEFRVTPTGKEVMVFPIAHTKTIGSGDAARQFTQWHNIECWNPTTIRVFKDHGFKGQKVLITGEWRIDEASGKYYHKVIANVIDILTWKKEDEDKLADWLEASSSGIATLEFGV